MKKTVEENYLARIEELEHRLEEAESLIEAIKEGEVDAFAITNNEKQEVFTLQSGDFAYRILVENINEGALNLSEDGLIEY
jgi:CRP-like cAMP-binding protein